MPQGGPHHAATGPFSSPLTQRFLWTSFHSRWACAASDALNESLPEEYRAVPLVEPDTERFEIPVVGSGDVPRLVGAIELVSPANKDRDETRGAFVANCVGILQSGAGLIVVDIVTSRAANFHAEILTRFTGTDVTERLGDLYASAYRPIRAEEGGAAVQIWPQGLALGQLLPTLPLWLTGGLPVRVDLNATYEETARRLRLPLE